MKNVAHCLPFVCCPVCGSKLYRDMVEQCSHADHEGNPSHEMVEGIWCVNESCVHATQGIDENDLVL